MLGSLGAFFALLAVLAVQVRAGSDPALGPAQPVASADQRRVVVHRVVLRRVIVTDRAGGPAAAPVASSGGAAPAPAAPAPSAPAPAPVTTGAS